MPTSPTLKVETLDNAIAYAIEEDLDTVISAINAPHLSWGLDENGNVNCRVSESKEIISGTPCLLNCAFLSEQGEEFHLVDYASAGRDWKTMIAAWLPTN